MAADPTRETKPEEEKEVPRKGGGKKRLILILGIFLFIAAGAGAVFFFAPDLVKGLPLLGTKEVPKEEKEKAPSKQGFIYDLDPFLVNLADTDPSRYLKIRINIESHESKENEGVKERLPRLRDAILTLLSSKTYREIYESEGKKKLKEEIIQRANQSLAGFQVKAVYFTEFVIQ
jgi:flagellar FliL protein